MFICKNCADKFGLPWNDTDTRFTTCGICSESNTCYPQDPESIIKHGSESDSSQDTKDPWYEDPIYAMYDGEYMDLARLLYVDAVYYHGLGVHFTYFMRGATGSSTQRRALANSELITMTTAKGIETFIKLVDGGQISKDNLEVARSFDHSKIFAVQVFEKERQKLITAWKRYRRQEHNRTTGTIA